MKVLFLNRCYGADSAATGALLAELCEDIAREHEVAVVAGPEPGHTPGVAEVGGVRVVRTRGTPVRKTTLAGRLAGLASYWMRAAQAALRERRPDVVVAETDPPLLGLLGVVVARRFGARFVYYCQDLYPDVARATGAIRSRPLLALLAAANRLAWKRADRVIVLGRDMRERVVSAGAAPERVAVLPNWVDCSRIVPAARSRLREQLAADGALVAMYAGNLGLSQGLDTVLDAAALLEGGGVLLVLVGEGARRRALERRVAAERLRGVVLLPRQPRSRLADTLAAADLHLVTLAPGVAGCLVPSKAYSALAAGRPIVAQVEADSEIGRLVREHDVGFVVAPGDAAALAETIGRAAAERSALQAMGGRARALAETRFDRRLATRRFCRILEETLAVRTPAAAVAPEAGTRTGRRGGAGAEVRVRRRCGGDCRVAADTTGGRLRAPLGRRRPARRAADPSGGGAQVRWRRRPAGVCGRPRSARCRGAGWRRRAAARPPVGLASARGARGHRGGSGR